MAQFSQRVLGQKKTGTCPSKAWAAKGFLRYSSRYRRMKHQRLNCDESLSLPIRQRGRAGGCIGRQATPIKRARRQIHRECRYRPLPLKNRYRNSPRLANTPHQPRGIGPKGSGTVRRFGALLPAVDNTFCDRASHARTPGCSLHRHLIRCTNVLDRTIAYQVVAQASQGVCSPGLFSGEDFRLSW